MKKNQDIYAGLGIIAFSLLMLTQASKLSEMQSIYPKILLIGMAIAGACVAISSVIKQKKTGVVYKKITLQFIKNTVLIPGAFLLVCALLVKPLGLYVTVFLLIIGICLIEDYLGKRIKDLTPKHILEVIAVSLVFTVLLYLLFHLVLKLPTPTGIFGF